MNIVTFPGLNLEFKLSKVAFSIKNIDIYWYAILMTSAFAIALIILKINDKKLGIKFSDMLDLSIYAIPISLLSARAYYVLFNMKYYISNPEQILNFKAGGLAIYGGIIGGIITCYIFSRIRKINILDLLDTIAPCLALRSSNRKMGKFYKCGSLWKLNKFAMENGNI